MRTAVEIMCLDQLLKIDSLRLSVEICCWNHLLESTVEIICWVHLLRSAVEINCWNQLLRLSVEFICWDQLLRYDLFNYQLRSAFEIICWDQLLILSDEFICWDQLLRSSAEISWRDQLLDYPLTMYWTIVAMMWLRTQACIGADLNI